MSKKSDFIKRYADEIQEKIWIRELTLGYAKKIKSEEVKIDALEQANKSDSEFLKYLNEVDK